MIEEIDISSVSMDFSIFTQLTVMVIAVGNRDGDTSSNPGRDWLHFT